ncbi:hypothetical protein AAC387_Pa02g2735 [Persea americana]
MMQLGLAEEEEVQRQTTATEIKMVLEGPAAASSSNQGLGLDNGKGPFLDRGWWKEMEFKGFRVGVGTMRSFGITGFLTIGSGASPGF